LHGLATYQAGQQEQDADHTDKNADSQNPGCRQLWHEVARQPHRLVVDGSDDQEQTY